MAPRTSCARSLSMEENKTFFYEARRMVCDNVRTQIFWTSPSPSTLLGMGLDVKAHVVFLKNLKRKGSGGKSPFFRNFKVVVYHPFY